MKKTFTNSEYGNGKFGKWIIDRFTLPAYQYTCMQTLDPIARTNTAGEDSIDHWHQVGNDRITLTAHNFGYLQFFLADRGMQWLSYFNSEKNCFGGGICFIEENNKIWSDLYNSKIVPDQMGYKRIFGCGYFQKTIMRNNLRIEHFIYPPFGDDPVVLSEISITNTSNQTRTISIYDYWGVRIKAIVGSLLSLLYMTKKRKKFGDSKLINLVLRGVKTLLLGLGLGSEQIRERFGSRFFFQSKFSNENKCLILTPKYKGKIRVKREQPADRNYYYNPIFLASYEKRLPIKYHNQVQIRKKNTSSFSLQKSYVSRTDSSPCVMLGHEITLKPKETKCLQFIFGTAEEENIPNLIKKYENSGQNSVLSKNMKNWKENLLYFSVESEPWLSREAAWHSYYLRSAELFDTYFNNHYLPQGNAYTFLHGGNGAIRDYVLFLIPMIYLNPQLAREMLEYIFRTMSIEGELPYAIVGVGQEMGAFVHETSSDLHLFLEWALLEYLYTTRDFEFLNKEIPFYPLDCGKTSTVLERIIIGLKFLFQKVGIGDHGLIKSGSGDWSDGISLLVKSRSAFLKRGESTFNSAFALYVFPSLIDLLKSRKPKIIKSLEKQYKAIKEACLNSWNGRWLYRGWDGMGNPIGNNNLFLEHHPWLLLSDILSQSQTKILIKNIYSILDSQSKTGQYVLYPPVNVLLNILPRGWDVNGGIWHAMNFLLTWAYSKSDISKGFQSLLKNSMARRAEVYPHIWYGIWSGSDSYNAEYAPNPGQTFIHPATPQTNFPIMNLNLHANYLSSIIKLVGINPTIEGLTIDPKVPHNQFQFWTPTFALEINETRIKGFYKPLKEDRCIIRVRKPNHWNKNVQAIINNRPTTEEFEITDEWLILKVKVPETGLDFLLKQL